TRAASAIADASRAPRGDRDPAAGRARSGRARSVDLRAARPDPRAARTPVTSSPPTGRALLRRALRDRAGWLQPREGADRGASGSAPNERAPTWRVLRPESSEARRTRRA